MPNRTIQFLGHGYGTGLASTTVTANGNTIFTGTVDTIDESLPFLDPASQETLNSTVPMFVLEVDQSFSGVIPMACTVTDDTVIFAQVNANYSAMPNPAYTPEQFAAYASSPNHADHVAIYTQVANPPLSQQDIDTLLDLGVGSAIHDEIKAAHNCAPVISSGPNVFVQIGEGPIYDPRLNVAIDGIPQNPNRGSLTGTWWWVIESGSTLTYNLQVPAAV
jgi:hypothetical protein